MRVALLLAGLAAVAWQAGPASPQLQNIKLPPGFRIAVYAEGVADARAMAIGPTAPCSSAATRQDVYALPDTNGDHRADRVVTIGSGFTTPTGIAFHDGALYVSEVSRISRLDNIERSLDAPPKPVVVNDTFPSDQHHGWKFIAFGPDGMLYVPVGAPCNVCEVDARHGIIARMKPDGIRSRDIRERRAQQRRLRLASGHEGAVVYRQRPRSAWRRHSARRVEPRAADRAAFGFP